MTPRERPILFSAPMVLAILDGRKTQTRRVIRGDHTKVFWHPIVVKGYGGWVNEHGRPVPCPFGVPGEHLWVRETWQHLHNDGRKLSSYEEWERAPLHCFYQADESDPTAKPLSGRWRPSIHMPRWASRITLEITDVRVQRLQEIGEEDAVAEGVNRIAHGREGYFYHAERTEPHAHNWVDPIDAYRELWDKIHGPDSWAANPWVWAITFRRKP